MASFGEVNKELKALVLYIYLLKKKIDNNVASSIEVNTKSKVLVIYIYRLVVNY